MGYLESTKRWLIQITEMGLLLVALFVVVQLLFGAETPFIGNVVGNLIELIKILGQNGLIGLIAIGIILYLFSKRPG